MEYESTSLGKDFDLLPLLAVYIGQRNGSSIVGVDFDKLSLQQGLQGPAVLFQRVYHELETVTREVVSQDTTELLRRVQEHVLGRPTGAVLDGLLAYVQGVEDERAALADTTLAPAAAAATATAAGEDDVRNNEPVEPESKPQPESAPTAQVPHHEHAVVVDEASTLVEPHMSRLSGPGTSKVPSQRPLELFKERRESAKAFHRPTEPVEPLLPLDTPSWPCPGGSPSIGSVIAASGAKTAASGREWGEKRRLVLQTRRGQVQTLHRRPKTPSTLPAAHNPHPPASL